jgi:translocation and assembly module TamB
VKVDGSAGLENWQLVPESGLRFRIDAAGVNAGELGRVAGSDLLFGGTVNARLEVAGTVGTPSMRGDVRWGEGSVQGHKFDSATSSVDVQGSHVSFKNFAVLRSDSKIEGSGAYDFATKTIQLKMAGSNFDVSELAALEHSRVRVGGKLDFSAEATGTTTQPEVTAHLHLRSITFNEEVAGDYLIDATTHGPDLRLTGRSDFKTAELSMDGSVRLRDQWPAHIDFHFARLDIDSFLETYLRGHITGHSAVAGDLVLQGPLRNPRQLSLTGNLTDLFADVERVKIRNDGPIEFSVSGEAFKIERLHILGEGTDFSAAGSMQLGGEGQLDLHANGTVGLQLVKTYDPDFSGSGTLKGEARVTGTYASPIVKGKLQVENGAITDINLPSALSDLNGTLVFSQNQITIQDLTARTGGGTVSFKGHAELYGRQINFDLSADADSVRLRYPPGVSSTASGTLRWTGSSSGSMLSGDITVNKLGVTPGFDFGAYLERAVQATSLPQTDPVLNRIRLDLHVVTAPELQMQTSVLRLRGEADLRVRGNAAKPVLLGRADVLEGEAYFNGTKYRLERGGVSFNNPAVTTPFLDLEATTHVRDYDITLSVNGPADKPKLNYRSEPPLPTNDIIGLLAFGQTTEQSAQLQQTSQSAFSQQASNAMLAAALNATLNNRTQRLFGNSRIKIDPQGLETETSPTQSGPAVTIEQQVKDNLTVTYTTNVAQTSQQIIRAEYNVTRNVSVVAIRDQNGVVSFDVKIRRRKR